jgi:uncharacterized protein involved in exopolysaccharide biosynthesis
VTQYDGSDELSFVAIGALLLRHRWKVAKYVAVASLVSIGLAFTRESRFKATASFAPQGSDASKSNLASLAGQFGVAIPAGGQTVSPEYYARLVKSRTTLRSLVTDSFLVAERGGKRLPLTEVFEIETDSPILREDLAIEQLSKMVSTSVSKATGVVEISVQSRWRSLSLELVAALVTKVNDFNQRSRQSQAGSERRFVEMRLALADSELRQAEDRMGAFVRANRQVSNSPDLTLERDRLDRMISQRQQVYTTLAQSYEDARIREVRDTPLITVVETPSVPARPEPRGRTKILVLGLLLGLFAGSTVAIVSDLLRRRRASGDPDATEFASAWGAMKSGLVPQLRRASSQDKQ